MRISDWSSDVCSSDLRQSRLLAFILVVEQSRVDRQPPVEEAVFRAEFERVEHFLTDRPQRRDIGGQRTEGAEAVVEADAFDTAREARRIGLVAGRLPGQPELAGEVTRLRRSRSAERRGGKEWVSTCRYRWSTYYSKNKINTGGSRTWAQRTHRH